MTLQAYKIKIAGSRSFVTVEISWIMNGIEASLLKDSYGNPISDPVIERVVAFLNPKSVEELHLNTGCQPARELAELV